MYTAATGWSAGIEVEHPRDLIARIEGGFAIDAADHFQKRLGLDQAEMARLLGLSARTLARRRGEGRLRPVESDRLYRFIRLYELASEVLASPDDAARWMTRPRSAFDGRTPIEHAMTAPGAHEVELLLRRVEHGIPV